MDNKKVTNPNYDAVIKTLLSDPAVADSQMFGMRSAKINGKAFAGLYAGKLVLKLGDKAKAMIAAGKATSFDPSGTGRAMGGWCVVDQPKTGVVKAWLALATEAKAFVAHRGDTKHAPENTMPAFELAIAKGVDGIELDVHATP